MQHGSHRLIIILGLLGLVVGYGMVVLTGPTAVANGRSCPMKNVICTGMNCHKNV